MTQGLIVFDGVVDEGGLTRQQHRCFSSPFWCESRALGPGVRLLVPLLRMVFWGARLIDVVFEGTGMNGGMASKSRPWPFGDLKGKRANLVYRVWGLSLVHTIAVQRLNLCGFLADGAMEKKVPLFDRGYSLRLFCFDDTGWQKGSSYAWSLPPPLVVRSHHYLDLIIKSVNKHASLSTHFSLSCQ